MSGKMRLQAEVELLSALEAGEVVTQMDLSKRLSISVGLVNALLKRMAHKGLLKATAAPYRRWTYYLTPHGFAEKSRLVAEYLDVSLDFFRTAREEYAALFVRARTLGFSEFVLVGRGELAEIAILAARGAEVTIIGILDREVNTGRLYGLPVLHTVDEVNQGAALIVTASRHPQEAYDMALEYKGDSALLAPTFLRIIARKPTSEATPKALY